MLGEPVRVEFDNESGKRVGMNIESASAFFAEGTLTVIGEVSSWSGRAVPEYRELQVVAYDSECTAVGRASTNWMEFGLRQTFECSMNSGGLGFRLFGVPDLVRLVPSRYDAEELHDEPTVASVVAARFKPGTANSGRTLEWDGYHFVISGFDTSLVDVLLYDANGDLDWLPGEWAEWCSHQRTHGLPPSHPLHTFGVTELGQLDGQSFERLCGLYFSRLGYAVEYTPAVGDGGVDLELRRGEEFLLVQCKRHARPVGEPVLRDLYGTVVHFNASGGVVCSAVGFTPAARAWSSGKALMLVDGDEILRGLA